MAAIIRTNQENPSEIDVEAGAEVIRKGGLVIFPTETVYGLGANALSEEACRKVFRAKNRPPDNPLIVHISTFEMLDLVACEVTADLKSKLKRVWPGPVTVLFRKKEAIPDVVTGGSGLVAVRMPRNRLALDLINRSGVPIAAPSANVSTRPSITDSVYADPELGKNVDLIYDCGKTDLGIESTIIDVTGSEPLLLRAGSSPIEELSKIFGEIKVTEFSRGLSENTVALAPGMKYKHYAPSKRLYLAESRAIIEQVAKTRSLAGKVGVVGDEEVCSGSVLRCISLGDPNDLEQIASRLFSAFRELEEHREEFFVVEPFQETGAGLAIMNRIRKASSGVASSLEDIFTRIGGF